MSAIKRLINLASEQPDLHVEVEAARTELAGYTEIGPCGKHLKIYWEPLQARDERAVEFDGLYGLCSLCREIEQAVKREREKYGKEIIHFEGFRYRRLLPATVHPGETVEEGPRVFSRAEIEREVAGMREACKEECRIVRDSPIECVDPCTEDWIAQRIDMLDSSAAQRGKQAIREEALREANTKLGDAITEVDTEINSEAMAGNEYKERAARNRLVGLRIAQIILQEAALIDKPGGR